MDGAQRHRSTAVITGATSGVGRIIALHLASQGTHVAGLGRDTAALRDLEGEAAALNGQVVGVHADVTERESVRRAFDSAESHHGPTQLVVACAGVAGALGPVTDIDGDAWWRDVTTDLLGTFVTLRESVQRMVPRGRGRVIALYGNLGDRGTPNVSAFASAKAAVARLSECLDAELTGSGVLVFCMHPGFIRTPMTEALAWGEAGRRFLPGFGEQAEKRWSDGRDTVALVDAIADGRADALTGRVLFPDDDLDLLTQQVTESPDLRRLRVSLDAQ